MRLKEMPILILLHMFVYKWIWKY